MMPTMKNQAPDVDNVSKLFGKSVKNVKMLEPIKAPKSGMYLQKGP